MIRYDIIYLSEEKKEGDSMKNSKIEIKNIVIRCFAVFLAIFAIFFGANRSGVCMGDGFFKMIGLKAWSDGTTGLHYVGVCSIVMLVIAVAMFSMTTKNATKTCRYILIGYIMM